MEEESKKAKLATNKKLKKKSVIKELIIIIIFCALVGALVAVSLAYQKEKNKKVTSEDIHALQQQEVGQVLSEIGKHIVLPEGVMPTVATITNVESLRKEMPFFDNAQNGFKVVVYEDKAILFDPANQIIVDVAPVYQQNSDMGVMEQQSEEVQEVDTDKDIIDEKNEDSEKEGVDNEEKSNIEDGEDSDEVINETENDEKKSNLDDDETDK